MLRHMSLMKHLSGDMKHIRTIPSTRRKATSSGRPLKVTSSWQTRDAHLILVLQVSFHPKRLRRPPYAGYPEGTGDVPPILVAEALLFITQHTALPIKDRFLMKQAMLDAMHIGAQTPRIFVIQTRVSVLQIASAGNLSCIKSELESVQTLRIKDFVDLMGPQVVSLFGRRRLPLLVIALR